MTSAMIAEVAQIGSLVFLAGIFLQIGTIGKGLKEVERRIQKLEGKIWKV